MNKLLIVLLAVCLVSAHAFVKRDAPSTEKNVLADLQNTIKDLGDKIGEEAKKAFNPEEFKKTTNAALDTVSKAFEELKNKLGPAAAGAKE